MQTFVTQQWKQSKEKSNCLHNKKLSEKKVKSPLHLFSTLRRWVIDIFPSSYLNAALVIFHGYLVQRVPSTVLASVYFLYDFKEQIKKHSYSFLCFEFVFLHWLNLLKLHFFWLLIP